MPPNWQQFRASRGLPRDSKSLPISFCCAKDAFFKKRSRCKQWTSQSSSGCRVKPIIPLPDVKTSKSCLLPRSSPLKFPLLSLLILLTSLLHTLSLPLWSSPFETSGFPGEGTPLSIALAGERYALWPWKLFRSGFGSLRFAWSYLGDLFSLDGVPCFL